RHVGELLLDRLVLRDPLSERAPLFRVVARDVVTRLRDADGLRRDADTAAVERLHRDPEALVLLAQEAVAADDGALDRDVVRRRRVQPELLLVTRTWSASRMNALTPRAPAVWKSVRAKVRNVPA